MIRPLAADSPDFNAADHTYWKDGREIVPVSTVIKEAGYIDTSRFTDHARDLGTRVHSVCEMIDWDMDPPDDDLQIINYVRGYRQFLEEKKPRWEMVEQRLYHPLEWYAGTPDRVGYIGDSRVIVDVKTGGIYSSYEVQLLAYANLFEEGMDFDLYDLQLKNVSTGRGYNLIQIPRSDYMSILNDFKAALIVYRRRQRNGLLMKGAA